MEDVAPVICPQLDKQATKKANELVSHLPSKVRFDAESSSVQDNSETTKQSFSFMHAVISCIIRTFNFLTSFHATAQKEKILFKCFV